MLKVGENEKTWGGGDLTLVLQIKKKLVKKRSGNFFRGRNRGDFAINQLPTKIHVV